MTDILGITFTEWLNEKKIGNINKKGVPRIKGRKVTVDRYANDKRGNISLSYNYGDKERELEKTNKGWIDTFFSVMAPEDSDVPKPLEKLIKLKEERDFIMKYISDPSNKSFSIRRF